jgi:MerR family regulatory protein
MSAIRTNAAAAMLGVSPNTLRSWEQRFGYPRPRRTEGGHRQFELGEVEALRQAFAETHNISSAISIAQERGSGLASPPPTLGARGGGGRRSRISCQPRHPGNSPTEVGDALSLIALRLETPTSK